MARPRSVPDEIVHDAVLALLRAGGPKAVTFGTVAAGAGLAASSLAQRHGTVDGMIRDALAGQWARAEAATEAALSDCPLSPKGAGGLLKALGAAGLPLPPVLPGITDPALTDLAAAWRARVEAELALRLGGGARGRSAAAILFAAWQGQALWADTGGRGFRLKDLLRRLAD